MPADDVQGPMPLAKDVGGCRVCEDSSQVWHQLLAERNRLRQDHERLTEAVRRYHDEHHPESAMWCAYPPCQLLFRPGHRR